MSITTAAVVFFSILFPSKTWFTPGQPINIGVAPGDQVIRLVLTDFTGKPFDAKTTVEYTNDAMVDLRELYATLDIPGAYILYAVPKDKDLKQFVGTPLIITVRPSPPAAGGAMPTAMVTKVDALKYAVMETDKGTMTLAFYYDVAPNTVDSFLRLAHGGFFDGLTFHRIVPDFVIQGGDPLGADPDETRRGAGDPGFTIGAEFSDRPHDVGVLSMAREGDPMERQGASPRPEFADSAGSQFFICLKRESTKQLDRKYTVFGKVTEGLDVVAAIGATPTDGENRDRPTEKREIKSVKVFPVEQGKNPYDGLLIVTDK